MRKNDDHAKKNEKKERGEKWNENKVWAKLTYFGQNISVAVIYLAFRFEFR